MRKIIIFKFYFLIVFLTIKPVCAAEPNFYEFWRVVSRKIESPFRLDSLEKRAKIAPLLPTFYTGYDKTLRETEGISIDDNISLSGGEITVGPEDNNYDLTVNKGDVIRLRAIWKLNELIYNSSLESINQQRLKVSESLIRERERFFEVFEKRAKARTEYNRFKNNSKFKSKSFLKIHNDLTDYLDAVSEGEFHGLWRKL